MSEDTVESNMPSGNSLEISTQQSSELDQQDDAIAGLQSLPLSGNGQQVLGIEEEEQELITRIKAGDITAKNILFERHHPTILKHIKKRLRYEGSDEVDDLAQETCIRALKKLTDYQREKYGPFIAWLKGIANKICQEYWHKQKNNHCNSLENLPPDEEVKVVDTNLPEEEVIKKERWEKYQEALADLSPKERQILLLRKEHLSYKEISQRIGGITEDNARTIFSRTKDKLHNWMIEHGMVDTKKTSTGNDCDKLKRQRRTRQKVDRGF